MKKIAAVLAFLAAAAPSAAFAQSSPGLARGQVPTAAQWNSYFAAKQDVLGFAPVNSAGGTMTGLLVTAASTTAAAGLRVNPGVAPTAPVDGDVWTTTAGIFVRVNGATVGPLVASTSAAGAIAIGGTAVTGSTSGRVLFANAGTLGQYVISGTGNVAMTTSPIFTTPTLGVAAGTSLALNGCTLGGNAFCATGSANISGATVIGGVLTYAGVTLSNAVTGSGSMVLSAAPTLTGHPTIEGVTATGATGTGRFVFDTAPSMSAVTITGSFTATGLVTVADLANATTTVNGVSCTLASTCTITATSASMTVGTTSVISGTTNQLLYDNGGALGEVTKGNNCVYGTNGTGVPSCGTTLPSLVVASSLTSVGTLTSGATGAGFTLALTTSTLTGTLPCAQQPAFTGDVTTSAGACANTIASAAVTNAKLANMANSTIKCRTTAGTGVPEDCTAAQAALIANLGSAFGQPYGVFSLQGGAQSITSGVTATIVWDTTIITAGSAFSAASGVITPTVAGTYQFCAAVTANGTWGGTSGTANIYLEFNSTIYAQIPASPGNGTFLVNMSGCTLVHVNGSTDTVKVQTNLSGTSLTIVSSGNSAASMTLSRVGP